MRLVFLLSKVIEMVARGAWTSLWASLCPAWPLGLICRTLFLSCWIMLAPESIKMDALISRLVESRVGEVFDGVGNCVGGVVFTETMSEWKRNEL